jgi:heavy metal-binding protein
MVRIFALLSAALLCAVFIPVPDSPSAQSSWAEGSPDLWAKIRPSAVLDPDLTFVCPMDRDVTSKTPGSCPRCGMKLVAGIPDSKEYPVEITTQPRVLEAGKDIQLTFRIEDPKIHALVRDFEIVHEKLYHFFVVSQDLSFFEHVHPELEPDATFRLNVRFPQPGMYRVLSDFYPKGGTPQLAVNTLLVSGGDLESAPPKLAPDLSPQRAANAEVELVTEPSRPLAGRKTTMSFRVKPNQGIEPYLGAWAHMLAADSDLIEMIHSHPIRVTDHAGEYKQLEFDMTFPRGGTYRVWVQSQRSGVVNTVAFNIPVGD